MINKNFQPFPELATARLVLRQVRKEDIDQIFEMLSNEEVAKYDYFRPVQSKEEAMKFIDRWEHELEENEEITW